MRRLVPSLVVAGAILVALLAPAGAAASSPNVARWPVPVPAVFWDFARWYLHRGPYAGQPPRDPATRPAAMPARVPAWAWRRLRVMLGETPEPLPTRALEEGGRGAAVESLQRSLRTIGFAPGPVDGRFGKKTRSAVIAFEKLRGLELDGRVPPEELAAILQARRPAPPLAEPGTYVYVDLGRQLLLDVRDGRVEQIVPVSTGGGYRYTGLDGREHVAVTPVGRFRVERRVDGWDESYLGRLYYPLYFKGGYAIHGSGSVPIRPVSHGCVRIPLWLAEGFAARHPHGTPVVVRAGVEAAA